MANLCVGNKRDIKPRNSLHDNMFNVLLSLLGWLRVDSPGVMAKLPSLEVVNRPEVNIVHVVGRFGRVSHQLFFCSFC